MLRILRCDKKDRRKQREELRELKELYKQVLFGKVQPMSLDTSIDTHWFFRCHRCDALDQASSVAQRSQSFAVDEGSLNALLGLERVWLKIGCRLWEFPCIRWEAWSDSITRHVDLAAEKGNPGNHWSFKSQMFSDVFRFCQLFCRCFQLFSVVVDHHHDSLLSSQKAMNQAQGPETSQNHKLQRGPFGGVPPVRSLGVVRVFQRCVPCVVALMAEKKYDKMLVNDLRT